MKRKRTYRVRVHSARHQNIFAWKAVLTIFLTLGTHQGSSFNKDASGPFRQILKNSSGNVDIPSHGLKIGDKIPEEVWALPLQVINHPEGQDTITLGDYKGKLIILDFWSTWCGSCIAGMPKMDSLQKKFGEKIGILPVTGQNKNIVSQFISEKQRLQSLELPFIVNDSVLKKLFPHRMIPHLVWISVDGKFLGSTWPFDSNIVTINKALNSHSVTFKTPKQDQLDYDYHKPLFVNGNGGNGNKFLYRSIITGYIQGIPGGVGGQRKDNTFRVYAYNGSLISLYKHAVKHSSWPANRIILEGEKAQKYRIKNWDEDKYTKGFCYELIVPSNRENIAYETMLEDLNKFSGLYGRIEKREVWCWVLVQKSETDLSEPAFDSRLKEDSSTIFRNMTLSFLSERLNRLLPSPVINKTTNKSKVDMVLPEDLTAISSLRKALQKYGLEIRKSLHKLDMLIISGSEQNSL